MTKWTCLLSVVLAAPAPLLHAAPQSWGRVDTFSNGGSAAQLGLVLDGDGQQVLMGTRVSTNHVVVYGLQAGAWTKSGTLVPPAPTSFFGLTVSIDGAWAVVSGGAQDVYLFRRAGGSWSYSQTFQPHETSSTVFGYDMDLSGDTLAVGDYTRSSPTLGGAVGLARYDGTAWVRELILEPADIQADDRFGRTLALDGNRLVATAPGRGTGAFYVFERIAGAWQQTAVMDLAMPYHAGPVELRGDRFIIGIMSGAPATGVAYVYDLVGGSWTRSGTLPDPARDPDSYFGAHVAIDGDRAVVSAHGADLGAPDAGRAFVYRYLAATGNWSLEQSLLPPVPRFAGGLGEGIALNGDQLVLSEGFYETVHVYDFLANASFRNGSGSNPAIYSGQPPVVGTDWVGQVDVTGHPGAGATIVAGFSASLPGSAIAMGELLVSGSQLFLDVAMPSQGVSTHGLAIPEDPSLSGTVAFTQAVVLAASGPLLCNAFDLTIGY